MWRLIVKIGLSQINPVPMFRKEEEERHEWELLKLINTSRTIYID
jgi:hypothetical protein